MDFIIREHKDTSDSASGTDVNLILSDLIRGTSTKDYEHLRGSRLFGIDIHTRFSEFLSLDHDPSVSAALLDKLALITAPSNLIMDLNYLVKKTVKEFKLSFTDEKKIIFNTNFSIDASVPTFAAMKADEKDADRGATEPRAGSEKRRRSYITVINPLFLCALTSASLEDVLMHEEMHHLYQHYETIDGYIREALRSGIHSRNDVIRAGELAIDCMANQRLDLDRICLKERNIICIALSIRQALPKSLEIPLVTKDRINSEFGAGLQYADDLPATFHKILGIISR